MNTDNEPASEEESRKRILKEMAEADYHFYKDETSERLRFQFEFSQAILRDLTLVNGGSIIALFTIIGSGKIAFEPILIRLAFSSFSLGLLFVFLAYIGAFFSQKFFMEAALMQAWNAQMVVAELDPRHDIMTPFKRGSWAFMIGIGLAILSLVGFVAGAAFAIIASSG